MGKLLATTTALAALAAIGSAAAADLPAAPAYKAPIAAPAYSWIGCYVGGNVGYAGSRVSDTLDNGAAIETFNYNPSSLIGGGQVGCQYQWSHIVLGAEGTWSGLRLTQTDTSVLLPGRLRTFTLDEIATAIVRLGLAWDRTLWYVKGGYASARIDTFGINPATLVTGDINSWQSGHTAGAGVEFMAMPNVVLGLEFNYYNFGFDRSGFATDGTFIHDTNAKAEVYSVVARASYLFNWAGPVVARY